MDLEVKLFNPRRVICEAVKITEENYQQFRPPDKHVEDPEKARLYLDREIARAKVE